MSVRSRLPCNSGDSPTASGLSSQIPSDRRSGPKMKVSSDTSRFILIAVLTFGVVSVACSTSPPDKGMYFIWDFTQLNVRPHSRVGLLKYKTAPKCSLPGPFRHSGVGRNPGAVGPVRSYNLNFTYPCQPPPRRSRLQPVLQPHQHPPSQLQHNPRPPGPLPLWQTPSLLSCQRWSPRLPWP